MTATVNASTSAGVIVTSDTSGALALQTAGTTALTISSAQAITMAGRTTNPTTMSVGGATPSTSGAGISFPASISASTDPNTLDDYEEGTWTPAFATWTTAPSDVVASYTKIGRQVTLNIVGFGGVCTAGSTITGIPFGGASAYGPASVLCTTNTNVVGFTAIIFDNGTQIVNVSTTAMGGKYWTCSFTYNTN
jgi:hypothetical protein